MKNLKAYIIEGIFDIEDNIDNIDKSIKEQIKKFLKDNFGGASLCKISRKPNKDGKYEVFSSKNIKVKNYKITSLTNGLFIQTTVGDDFYCDNCTSLTSLKGAPKEVGVIFCCEYCKSLKSLEGAPEKVDDDFYCSNCKSLTSLEGAPKEVDGNFCCSFCGSMFTREDVKKVSNVKGRIIV